LTALQCIKVHVPRHFQLSYWDQSLILLWFSLLAGTLVDPEAVADALLAAGAGTAEAANPAAGQSNI
jgi:hypothetical protein